ncbi:hypothetical protein AMTR_s00109p00025130 [Amborella trichopoda]|uniref:Uncharacterized protein n=1 Tax=Amborella trichopoda TaxID=13333 RepID=W1NV54_AMBTC|nr:hypothetical protein AMTR_s00109p00025130 [Amborella trichopoda]
MERENCDEANGEGNPTRRRGDEEAEENREKREEEAVVVKEKAVSMRKRPTIRLVQPNQCLHWFDHQSGPNNIESDPS